MQQPPAPPPTNPLTEIAAIVIAALFVIGGVALLFTHTIDLEGATTIFVIAVGILSVNVALKSPSPAQQAQIGAIFTQIMQVIPAALARMQTPVQPTPIVIHNNIPPSATVPAVPIAAAAQPTPVQITPNMFRAQSINALNQPTPAPVAQQEFPAPTFPSRFGDAGGVPVPPAVGQ